MIDSIPTGVVSEPGPVVYTVPALGKGQNILVCGWLNTNAASTTPLFDISCTVGSIIDIEFNWQMVNEIAGYAQAVTASALGSFGHLPLDAAGGTYIPLGLPTLT